MPQVWHSPKKKKKKKKKKEEDKGNLDHSVSKQKEKKDHLLESWVQREKKHSGSLGPSFWLSPIFLYFFFFLSFVFSRATPMAHGGSQPRGPIRTTAASLHHSHSNARSKPPLRPYTTAHSSARSLTHWAKPGIKPETSWFLVGFVNHWAKMGTPCISSFLTHIS